jgi:hypothetical protein
MIISQGRRASVKLFTCIGLFYANTSFITVFMLFIDMMCNEIEFLIFRPGGYVFYTLLEQISMHYWSIFLYIVGALICAPLHNYKLYTLLKNTSMHC